jgi:hypothetical protein
MPCLVSLVGLQTTFQLSCYSLGDLFGPCPKKDSLELLINYVNFGMYHKWSEVVDLNLSEKQPNIYFVSHGREVLPIIAIYISFSQSCLQDVESKCAWVFWRIRATQDISWGSFDDQWRELCRMLSYLICWHWLGANMFLFEDSNWPC